MRVLVLIIAVLAFLGGLAHILGGMLGFGGAILMLTTKFPSQVQSPEMPPLTIGLILLFSAALMFANGVLFVLFALGAFKRKRWARPLGIFAYALNIVVCLATMAFSTVEGSPAPWIAGTIVAALFMTILLLAKNEFATTAPARMR